MCSRVEASVEARVPWSSDRSWRPDMERFRELISRFHERQIPAHEFEREYLSRFKACEEQFPEAVFEALNELFLDLDAFCDNPALRDDSDLDEATLRQRVATALSALQSL